MSDKGVLNTILTPGRWFVNPVSRLGYSDLAYINGFYRAGVYLAEIAQLGRDRDVLYPPICLSFRHYLELHLKHCLFLGTQIESQDGQSDDGDDSKTSIMVKKLSSTHSLQWLLNQLSKCLAAIDGEQIPKNVQETILAFHQIDPNGQAFRYPRLTDGSPSLPQQKCLDAGQLSALITKANKFLMLLEISLDEQLGKTAQIFTDFIPERHDK